MSSKKPVSSMSFNKKSPRKPSQPHPLTARSQSNSNSNQENNSDESLIEKCVSSVQSSSPNGIYPASIWSREHLLKSSNFTKSHIQSYHPHGLSEHGELTLLAKTRYRFRNLISDKIGSAQKSTLQLQVEHLGRLVRLDSFVVLGFDIKEAFYWSKNSTLGALRLGYDVQKQEIIYAARKFETIRGSKFGSIQVRSLLAVTNSNLTSDLELLCLKSSPKSLKSIVRDYLRNREPLKRDNLNVDKLDLLIESNLLSYIKYSNRLKLGNELRPTDSLISKNGEYRLSLEEDGRLLLYLDSTRGKYLYLARDVESLWFYDLAVLVVTSSKNNRALSSCVTFPSKGELVAEFLSRDRVALCKHSIVLRLSDDGAIEIVTRLYEFKLVIQFRDDIKSMWNADEPKSESMCFVVKNELNDSELDDSSDDDDDDESSSSSSDHSNNHSDQNDSDGCLKS